MPILEARGISKHYSGQSAVAKLSLQVEKGKIVALLGPSGCGKTTTLRLLAGLEVPDDGDVLGADGRVLVSTSRGIFVPPHRRNMGMVFQSYAIWPHMSVYENVAYPLRRRRLKNNQIRNRVSAILETVGMSGYEERAAPTLSGGQQQRVALARALVAEPDLLLLDEPFSNLDQTLREHMRHEIGLLQRKLGLSIVLVTHDQVEALSLADHMIVMSQGKVHQVGAPTDLYANPATPFVRDFLGKMAILDGTVVEVRSQGRVLVQVDGYPGCPIEGQAINGDGIVCGQEVQLAVRPEDISVAAIPSNDHTRSAAPNALKGVIDSLFFIGSQYETRLTLLGGQYLPLYLRHTGEWAEGQQVELVFPASKVKIWSR